MKRDRTALIIITTLLILALFFFGLSLWLALKPSFSAINYLEGKGYTSVRILHDVSEGHGCKPDDTYRKVFDAISSSGEKKVSGNVCGGGEAAWYEEER